VVVVEPALARPDVRAHLAGLDAFVTRGGNVIYLVSSSPLVRLAESGHSTAVHVLAAVIWHEMAHLEGASEAEARRREEDFWTRCVRDGKVDAVTGLRYLRLLKQRSHDDAELQRLARLWP
jgi:hypothetical protein